MPGVFSVPRRFWPRAALCLALLSGAAAWLGSGGAVLGQEVPAASPAPTPVPIFPAVEPVLPSDPTAPTTIQTSAVPVNPLIPEPILPGAVPPRSPATSAAPLQPAALVPADPMAIPVAAPAQPEATTTNIGTARRFQYAFALTLGATYDDNIFLEPSGQTRADLFFTLQPTVVLGLGGGQGGGEKDNLVRFSYSPQALLYVDHGELDTVQHFVSLSGTYHFNRLTVRGLQEVQILDNTDVGNPHPSSQISPVPGGAGTGANGTPVANNPVSSINLDVGQRTRYNLYNTSLSGNYYLSDKLSFDLSGQVNISDYAGELYSTRQLSGSGFFNYSATGKTTVGVGFTGGYVVADRPNPDQSFEQVNLRLSYVPGPKLIFSGQVGLEFRQSTDRDNTAVTPVFDLSVTYNPFDGTAFTLSGNRQVYTSAVLAGQDYRLTGFTLSFSQRFFQRFFTRLSIGYTNTDYVATVGNVAASRTDDYFFFQPGLDYNLRENLTVGGFYSRRQSASSQGNRNFSDNQVGARVSYAF